MPAKGVHPALPTAVSRKANERKGKQAFDPKAQETRAFPRSILHHRARARHCAGASNTAVDVAPCAGASNTAVDVAPVMSGARAAAALPQSSASSSPTQRQLRPTQRQLARATPIQRQLEPNPAPAPANPAPARPRYPNPAPARAQPSASSGQPSARAMYRAGEL